MAPLKSKVTGALPGTTLRAYSGVCGSLQHSQEPLAGGEGTICPHPNEPHPSF